MVTWRAQPASTKVAASPTIKRVLFIAFSGALAVGDSRRGRRSEIRVPVHEGDHRRDHLRDDLANGGVARGLEVRFASDDRGLNALDVEVALGHQPRAGGRDE